VLAAQPNEAHIGLAELENDFDVHVITQNIDDLHERAGSTKVLHLHGEILKMRSEKNDELIYDIRDDISIGDKAEDGCQLRPHIVWFEEPVPKIEEAIPIVFSADLFAVVGTSLVVYPAAGLLHYAAFDIPKYIIDKKIPDVSGHQNIIRLEGPATEGVRKLKKILLG
jgi:NAD-dependent deacetylase